jgi:geranylgeranyl pyrophosphate synthase
VETENPVLTSAAKHFFEKRHGKRFRPTIVMLMCRCLDPFESMLMNHDISSKLHDSPRHLPWCLNRGLIYGAFHFVACSPSTRDD